MAAARSATDCRPRIATLGRPGGLGEIVRPLMIAALISGIDKAVSHVLESGGFSGRACQDACNSSDETPGRLVCGQFRLAINLPGGNRSKPWCREQT
jgi:hypothetical protein